MRTRLPISHLAVSVLLLGSALLALGCGEDSDYETVDAATPEFATTGPILTMSQWRQRVGAVCRQAMIEVSAVSTDLVKQIQADPSALDEASISRAAFEVSRPVIEQQLSNLAELRPPPSVEEDYREFVSTLAMELDWSGRIAHMIGEEGVEDELRSADQSLAAAAAEVSSFVQAQRLRGCLPSLKSK